MVVAFDPCHDRAPEFITGDPASTVEDVMLQLNEEGFHGCVVGR